MYCIPMWFRGAQCASIRPPSLLPFGSQVASWIKSNSGFYPRAEPSSSCLAVPRAVRVFTCRGANIVTCDLPSANTPQSLIRLKWHVILISVIAPHSIVKVWFASTARQGS